RTALRPGKARDRQAFRASERAAGVGLAVAPSHAGARVVQHAHDDEIDERTCALGWRKTSKGVLERRESFHASRFEMTEAAVGRNFEIGKARSRELGRESRGVG